MLLPIKLTLAGGLGNQLFQLSAGIYLEEILGRKVIYDVSYLTTMSKAEIGIYNRKLEIYELILDGQAIKTRYPFRADYLVRFIRRLVSPDSVVIESDPNFNALEQVDNKTTAIYGYFQRASTVAETWPILQSRIMNSSKFASLVDSELVARIAIHLRFGDYSDDPGTKAAHGLTSTKYFEQSINSIKLKEGTDIPILVVTDDPIKANNFLSGLSDLNEISIISNTNPIDDLVELCRSSHVVIANSTFSWWGGWIANKVHNSKVIYPRPWFADNADPELPIYVAEWTGIKREFSDI